MKGLPNSVKAVPRERTKGPALVDQLGLREKHIPMCAYISCAVLTCR